MPPWVSVAADFLGALLTMGDNIIHEHHSLRADQVGWTHQIELRWAASLAASFRYYGLETT